MDELTLSRSIGIIALSLAAQGTSTAAKAQEEPDLIVVSPVGAAAIEERALEIFMANELLSADAGLTMRLEKLGQRVVDANDGSAHPYKFRVLQGEAPQAYSFPGGTICVTEGLMELLRDKDDELAFAIGHELGHITLRHRITQLRWEVRIDGATQRGEQVQDRKKQDKREEKLARTLLEATYRQFNREHEVEADQHGALYAMRAGYAFSAARRLLKRLEESGIDVEDATHPTFRERADRLNEAAGEIQRALDAFKQGVVELQGGRAKDAIGLFDLYLHEFPGSAAGWINRGAAHLAEVRRVAGTPQGLAESLPILPEPEYVLRGGYSEVDLERAAGSFERALRIEPRHVDAKAGLALVLMRRSESARAQQLLEQALADAPDERRPVLLLALGNSEFLQGHYEDAAAQYRAALDSRRDWADARANLAMTHERLDDLVGAIRYWERLAADPRWGDDARRFLARYGTGPG